MPRKRKFNLERLINLLIENKSSILDDSQKNVRGPKEQCWINISNLMNRELEPFYVYVIVKTNRYKILDKLNLYIGLNEENDNDKNKSIEDINRYTYHGCIFRRGV